MGDLPLPGPGLLERLSLLVDLLPGLLLFVLSGVVLGHGYRSVHPPRD